MVRKRTCQIQMLQGTDGRLTAEPDRICGAARDVMIELYNFDYNGGTPDWASFLTEYANEIAAV
eukprot:4855029-Karenia_brevis.AAC.1